MPHSYIWSVRFQPARDWDSFFFVFQTDLSTKSIKLFKRCSQLMRHVGQELRLILTAYFKLFCFSVQYRILEASTSLFFISNDCVCSSSSSFVICSSSCCCFRFLCLLFKFFVELLHLFLLCLKFLHPCRWCFLKQFFSILVLDWEELNAMPIFSATRSRKLHIQLWKFINSANFYNTFHFFPHTEKGKTMILLGGEFPRARINFYIVIGYLSENDWFFFSSAGLTH